MFALAAAGPSWAGPIDQLTFYTEHYPPYNMTIDGKLRGIAGELTAAIFAEADTTLTVADVKLAPWPRGYQAVQHKPNTVLFSTARTEQREDLFRWVGPIAANRMA